MARWKEVESQLAKVLDPELDRPLTELGFIDDVAIRGSEVTVLLRLPTYWCSPNFAFIMASDVRERLFELRWVTGVTVLLKDHCFADEINRGIAEGKSFSETFPGIPAGDLDELRKTFRIKAFVSRQERLLRYLLRLGMNESAILELTVQELQELANPHTEGKALIERYLAVREELGFSNEPRETAFVRADGKRISAERFAEYLLEGRRTRISMEFNANYCRGLLETRYSLKE
ncbi:iron-sulfur cluster assembly protein [Bacillaceae bacterium]